MTQVPQKFGQNSTQFDQNRKSIEQICHEFEQTPARVEPERERLRKQPLFTKADLIRKSPNAARCFCRIAPQTLFSLFHFFIVNNRVTGLGEFSPIGRLFSLGSFSKLHN
jgi:hypothetical protein